MGVGTDRRQMGVGTDRRPMGVGTDRRPMGVGTDRRPSGCGTDGRPTTVQSLVVLAPRVAWTAFRVGRSCVSCRCGFGKDRFVISRPVPLWDKCMPSLLRVAKPTVPFLKVKFVSLSTNFTSSSSQADFSRSFTSIRRPTLTAFPLITGNTLLTVISDVTA